MAQKKKSTVVLITALVFAGLFLGNYGQFQLAAVPSLIYENYGLNDLQFSTVMTSPMVPAIFFSIVLGVLSDRFGIKKMGIICVALGVLGYVLRWAFDGYAMLYVGMFLTGFLATIFNTNVSKIAAALYPPEKVGGVIGIFMAGSTGAMAFAYATTAMFPTLDAAFLFPVFAAALHLALWVLFVRQKDLGETARTGEAEKGALMQALKVSLKSGNVWLMGLALFALMGGTMVISNFQVVYLTTARGYTEAAAGTFGTVLMVGAILGSVLIPMYLPKCRKPALFLLAIALISAVASVGIALLPAAGIYVSSFVNGFLRSGVLAILMSFPVMFPEIGPRYAGTASGVACTLQLMGAVVVPTYIVLPLAGGNMVAYFFFAAVFFAVAGVLGCVVARKLKF